MASTVEFVTYATEQLGGEARGVTNRKMFGEYGLHCYGQFFGVICNDTLYLKPTQPGEELLRAKAALILEPPYEGAKNYLLIENLEDTAFLAELLNATLSALPLPMPKKQRKPKHEKA